MYMYHKFNKLSLNQTKPATCTQTVKYISANLYFLLR